MKVILGMATSLLVIAFVLKLLGQHKWENEWEVESRQDVIDRIGRR